MPIGSITAGAPTRTSCPTDDAGVSDAWDIPPARDPWAPRIVRSGTEYARRKWWHRWDVVSDQGWIDGFLLLRQARNASARTWLRQRIFPPFPDEPTQELTGLGDDEYPKASNV